MGSVSSQTLESLQQLRGNSASSKGLDELVVVAAEYEIVS